jgi:hypothetical protein
MWPFYGNETWIWFCLIPFLCMIVFMAMMFAAARRCMRGMAALGASGGNSVAMNTGNQADGTWRGMRGSMMRSCMGMMSRQMAPRETELQGAFRQWSRNQEQKILELLDQKMTAEPAEISAALGIDEETCASLIQALVLEGKLQIGAVKKPA